MASSSAAGAATHLSHPAIRLQIPPQPATVRGAPLHLGRHPKKPSVVVYPSGKYIIVRDLQNPSDVLVYRGHNHATSVAKFSPSGNWVASGDASGRVRVWAYDNPEHILKLETQVFSGEVKDLDWDPENKRIVAVGDGQGTNAKVFLWDTGNSVGELNGHGKRVTSCAYRPCRPFRLITGSEDTRTVFYTGPPFVLGHSNNDQHSNWVNAVRYAPDGAHIVSVGSDKKIVVYDGATGESVGEVADAHAGSIYSVAFAPDGKRFATASADKTVKVWDLVTRALEATYAWDEAQLGDMQNGVLWLDAASLATVSLNGDVNLLDPTQPPPGARTAVHGHQVTITALAASPDSPSAFYTASYDGVVMGWDKATGKATRAGGPVPRSLNLANHGGKVTGMVLAGGGATLKSVGFDDRLRAARLQDGAGAPTYEDAGDAPLPGQPIAIASGSAASDVAAIVHRPAGLVVYRGAGAEKVSENAALPFTPASVAVWGEEEVAVGGEDHKVYIYSLLDPAQPKATLEGPRGKISALAFSPDGQFLAVGDSNREVSVFSRDGDGWTAKVQGQWVHHTSRVTALAWSPGGQHLASGSLDANIIIWSVENPKSRITLDAAHKDGVTVLGWLGEQELVSSGNDAVILLWDLAKCSSK